MNNKILDYGKAVKKLKDLEYAQRKYKMYKRQHKSARIYHSHYQKLISENKREINLMLSIIIARKEARKLWAEKERWMKRFNNNEW